jgi:benzoylformate decarboxylase
MDVREALAAAAPDTVVRAGSLRPEAVREVAALLERSSSPTLVVGAGSASVAGWEAVTALAERLRCPVWQEPFASRAYFPHDHSLFAGHLPWTRRELHDRLAPHDLVLAGGTSAFRTYLFDEAVPMVEPTARVAVISDDPEEAHHSRCDLAVLGPVAESCAALAAQLSERVEAAAPRPHRPPPAPPPPKTATCCARSGSLDGVLPR